MIASGAMRRKLRAEFFVVLDLVWLADLQSQLQARLLYRRKRKFHAPALWAGPAASPPEAQQTRLPPAFPE